MTSDLSLESGCCSIGGAPHGAVSPLLTPAPTHQALHPCALAALAGRRCWMSPGRLQTAWARRDAPRPPSPWSTRVMSPFPSREHVFLGEAELCFLRGSRTQLDLISNSLRLQACPSQSCSPSCPRQNPSWEAGTQQTQPGVTLGRAWLGQGSAVNRSSSSPPETQVDSGPTGRGPHLMCLNPTLTSIQPSREGCTGRFAQVLKQRRVSRVPLVMRASKLRFPASFLHRPQGPGRALEFHDNSFDFLITVCHILLLSLPRRVV